MNTTPVFEFAEFSLNPGFSESDLLNASGHMQSAFLDRQAGFLSRDLLVIGDGRYMDWVVWQSAELADVAMHQAASNAACGEYFAMMDVGAPPRMLTPLARYGVQPLPLGLEFSTFRLNAGAKESDLPPAAANLVHGLYGGQSGYRSHAIFTDGKGSYADVLLADSQAQAQSICQSWYDAATPSEPVAAAKPYLSLIDPSSVKLSFWQRVG